MDSFKEIMADHTDEALVRILYFQKEDYQPEALEAARSEFTQRNITETRLNYLVEKIRIEQKPVGNKKWINIQTWQDFLGYFYKDSQVSLRERFFMINLLAIAVFAFFVADQWYEILETAPSILHPYPNLHFYISYFEFIGFYLLFFSGIFGLMYRKRFGWIFIMVTSMYWSLSLLESFGIALYYNGKDSFLINDSLNLVNWLVDFVIIPHQETGWPAFLAKLIISLFLIYMLNFYPVKRAFGINRAKTNFTIILSTILFIAGLIILGPIWKHHFT
jgi:hypothetical protein